MSFSMFVKNTHHFKSSFSIFIFKSVYFSTRYLKFSVRKNYWLRWFTGVVEENFPPVRASG